MLARGLTNRQIAKELVLSERTVENHVSNILKKLKLSSRYRGCRLGGGTALLSGLIRKLAELKNARIFTEGEFEVKEACAPEGSPPQGAMGRIQAVCRGRRPP